MAPRRSGQRKPGPRPVSHSGKNHYKSLKQNHAAELINNKSTAAQKYKKEFQTILDNLEVETIRQIATIQASLDEIQAENVILVQQATQRARARTRVAKRRATQRARARTRVA
jgi:hypothetical protein